VWALQVTARRYYPDEAQVIDSTEKMRENKANRETRNMRFDDDLSKNALIGGWKAKPIPSSFFAAGSSRDAPRPQARSTANAASARRRPAWGECHAGLQGRGGRPACEAQQAGFGKLRAAEKRQNVRNEPNCQGLQHPDRQGLECVPRKEGSEKRSLRQESSGKEDG
jgi:hypothetical protein